MDAATTVVSPAAGPLTLSGDLLKKETTTPPMIPESNPAYNGAPDANAIPKQSGSATRNTERPAGRSCFNHRRR